MKTVLALLMFCSLAACGGRYKLNQEIVDNALLNQYQVVYKPSINEFSNSGMSEGRIVMTKSISSGSGSYSDYTWGKKTVQLPTTYEFLLNGKFYGYNGHNLKFYDIVYKAKTLQAIEMSSTEVAKLFPELKIVLVSSLIKGQTSVSKLPFESVSFLLLNDTEYDFYKYSFEGALPSQTPFKGVLSVADYGTVIFSHYGADDAVYPAIKIEIKL